MCAVPCPGPSGVFLAAVVSVRACLVLGWDLVLVLALVQRLVLGDGGWMMVYSGLSGGAAGLLVVGLRRSAGGGLGLGERDLRSWPSCDVRPGQRGESMGLWVLVWLARCG